MKRNLIGRKAMIKEENDNDNYKKYRGKVLIITHADNKGRGYDSGMYPEMLCSFTLQNGLDVPFSLYEYEFNLL
jgi:hypothetical protein